MSCMSLKTGRSQDRVAPQRRKHQKLRSSFYSITWNPEVIKQSIGIMEPAVKMGRSFSNKFLFHDKTSSKISLSMQKALWKMVKLNLILFFFLKMKSFLFKRSPTSWDNQPLPQASMRLQITWSEWPVLPWRISKRAGSFYLTCPRFINILNWLRLWHPGLQLQITMLVLWHLFENNRHSPSIKETLVLALGRKLVWLLESVTDNSCLCLGVASEKMSYWSQQPAAVSTASR